MEKFEKTKITGFDLPLNKTLLPCFHSYQWGNDIAYPMVKLDQVGRKIFLLLICCAFAVGAILRLRMLPGQILLDDEWQSVDRVIGATCFDLLTEFNPHDNTSLLLNFYDLALYHYLNWSEFTLRLPVILAGLLSLLLLPVLVGKVFNARVAILFAFLLAIAPFPIFYSRYARAYGFVILFGFAALLWFHLWLATGKPRNAVAFGVSGLLAIYAHLFSMLVVFIPFAIGFGVLFFSRFKKSVSSHGQVVVPLRTLATAAAMIILFMLPLLCPVLSVSARLPWQRGNMTLHGVITAAMILSGTENPPLNILFYFCCASGLMLLVKQNPLLGWSFLSTFLAYAVLLLISRPFGVDAGAILLRYMIVVVPMALVLVALALDYLLHHARNLKAMPRWLPMLGAGVFFAFLYAKGPLPAIYVFNNNFTNHSAFQGSYKRKNWEASESNSIYSGYSIKENQIPHFYRWLGAQPDIDTIIEYPFDICDYNDLFYYYQHFHKKRVIAGYSTNPALLGYAPEEPLAKSNLNFTLGIWCADTILCPVETKSKLAFRNMVDILDPVAISRSGAEIMVLHKDVRVPKIMSGPSKAMPHYETIPVRYRSVELLRPNYKQVFGSPVYEDAGIICFRIKRAKLPDNP